MRYYFGIVHQEADSAFGINFPDVQGCFSAAGTMDELCASEALSLHLEGETLPLSRILDAVRSDKDVIKDLEDSAFILAVPLIHLRRRNAKANITMDARLLAAVDQSAKERGLTRSAFLADLTRREITT